MNDRHIIKIAAIGFVALVVAPKVVNVGCYLVQRAATGIYNVVEKVTHDRRIKKGLKDGSIVEIDGEYYEVEISNPK